MKQYDIVALGEVLVDMSQCGVSAKGNAVMEASPGGAPCNMLSMASKLGSRCAFIGKVGDDHFGHMLHQKLEQQGIDCAGLVADPHFSTTLAFVHRDLDGERSYSFCRKPGADEMLCKTDVNLSCLQSTTIFHFGTLSSTNPCGREATQFAVEKAREYGCLISFDPNIRHALWPDTALLRQAIDFGLKNCNILKVSDEELWEITGSKELADASEKLVGQYSNIDLLIVTLGAKGGYIKGKDFYINVDAYDAGAVQDTTGAGDSFCGCMDHFLAQNPNGRFDKSYVSTAARYGSIAAGIIVTRIGSMCEMPSLAEIKNCIYH